MNKELQHLLIEGNYNYRFENGIFIFQDSRIKDITARYENYKLYDAIRKEDIKVLDISKSSCPSIIAGFPQLEKIIFPKLQSQVPEISSCPNLETVIFDPQEITSLQENSFKGWPPIQSIVFGEKLKHISTFGIIGNFQILDFSKCCNLYLSEHALQRCKVREVILPDHITKLPSYFLLDSTSLKRLEAKGVTELGWECLSKCRSLTTIEFAPQFNNEDRLLKMLSEDDYRLDCTGILIDSDQDYSYLWSFTDLKFYFCSKLASEICDEILTFKRSNSITLKRTNELIRISSTYHSYAATDVEIENSNFRTNSLYNVRLNTGIYFNYKSLQSEAISQYLWLKKNIATNIRQYVSQIENQIENLDIDDIIKSYSTEVSEHVVTKVGGDDRFYSRITTGSSYTDAYLETLLPSTSSHYKETGYTSNWPWTSSEKIEEFNRRDAIIREKARKEYSKEDHIDYLLNKLLRNISQASSDIETYLHISRAKELAGRIKYKSGKERVQILNDTIEFN